MQGSPLKLAGAISAAFLFIAGCVAGSLTSNRELESLSISPTTATANGSTVQFTATGYWSTEPTTETPMAATWGACAEVDSVPASPTTDVTVSSTGLASCSSGAQGTYDVFAWAPQYGGPGAVCNVISACGPGCGRVAASAQLTCP